MEEQNYHSQAEIQSKQSTEDFKNEAKSFAINKIEKEIKKKQVPEVASKAETPTGATATAETTPGATSATAGTAATTTGTTSATVGATVATAGATGATAGTTGATVGATGATVGATGATVGATGATAGTTGATVGATGATAGATGAASAGIGAAVVLTLTAVKAAHDKAKAEIESIEQSSDSSKKSGGCLIPFLVIILLPFLLLVIGVLILFTPVFLLGWYITGVAEDGASYIAGLFYTEKERYFRDLFDEEFYTEELEAFVNSPRKFDSTNMTIYQRIIDDAVDKAFREHAVGYTSNIEFLVEIFQDNFSYLATYEQYLDQPYPYTLRKDEDEDSYYTIREYLNGEIPEDEVNNDLNYAEILCVLCQREEYDLEGFSYSSFYDLLMNDKVGKLLFEYRVKDETALFGAYDDNNNLLIGEDAEKYLAQKGIEAKLNPPTEDFEITDTFKNQTDFPSGFYFHEIEVAAYGLDELYQIAELDPYDYHYATENMYNYVVLNTNEQWLRETITPSIDLGPAYNQTRNPLSMVYDYIEDDGVIPTGRSAFYYLTDSITGREISNPIWCKGENVANRFDYSPTGESVILNFPNYIQQNAEPWKNIPIDPGSGSSKGVGFVGSIGCCICSYTMVLDYYQQTSSTTGDMRNTIKNYVVNDGDRNMDALPFMEANGLSYVSASQLYEQWPDLSQTEIIVNLITEGKPAILFINGKWEYDGKTYHRSTNTHFLVAVGYDETGIYVFDPGSKSNTENGPIPYDAFAVAPSLEVRSVYGGNAYYKVNTISGIGVEETNE